MKECLWYKVCNLKSKLECDSRGNTIEYDLTVADNPMELEGIRRRCKHYEEARAYRLRNRHKR